MTPKRASTAAGGVASAKPFPSEARLEQDVQSYALGA
jgi:hypothetical protein